MVHKPSFELCGGCLSNVMVADHGNMLGFMTRRVVLRLSSVLLLRAETTLHRDLATGADCAIQPGRPRARPRIVRGSFEEADQRPVLRLV